jgi:protein involved in polysaccharide export with SLBB domain
MNFRISILFFFVCFLFTTFSGYAQVNPLGSQNISSVKIDNITDNEILVYLQKAKDNGISEQGIYRILQEKGLPEEELDKLMERIQKLSSLPAASANVGQNEKSVDSKANIANRDKRSYNQDASTIPQQKNQSDLSVFGSELFTTNSIVFEPNLRIPTPSGYILGPDDELIVNVFGYSEKTYHLNVNEEGNIYIPQVGPIFVNGLSIEQASTKIKSKLGATIYKAIGSGRTRVQISLGKIRSIRVTVIGEAKKPGTYTVSSLTTVFNLLYLCGGPSDLGSYRNIELIRGNELKRKVDLYSFLTKGNQRDNVLLNEGDVIRIPYYQTRVILNGNVRHKGKYELKDDETFEHILQYSGGFADDAYKTSVTVYQYTEKERRITDLIKNQYGSYKPHSSDSIVVGKLLNRFENKLIVKGAVMRPGEYELSSGLTLKALLEKAGGVKEDVYNKRGSISRLNDNNMPVQVSFDIDSIMKDQTKIYLKKNDSITVYSIFDFDNEATINIDGNVKKPGKYRWAENITLRDMILKAGGLNEIGDSKNIEIARRITNLKLTEVNHLQTEIISVDLSDSSATNDIVLKPYDVINIRQKSDYVDQRIVIVEGMVLNPGRYTLQMSGDRISDIIKRAGGVRANADTTAMVIKRISKRSQSLQDREKTFSKLLNINSDSLNSTERIKNEIYKEYDKISIDLNKALHEKNETDNMLLEDGDILSIEQNTSLVKVSGEVYYPTIIPFKEGENLKYYIQKSGSYTDLARKNGTLVVYPDGKAKKAKHFLFFKSYPKVVSRSEIFVPQKNDKNRGGITLGEWSVILSSLAIVANVIINLKK